ncbi:MAG: shikimate kinase [Nitrospirae bacterium]|nr:shikimate kinase [Nitrospirota bacterium]
MNIILTGFMGSGKTAVGRSLAGRLGYAFTDTDLLVEAKTGKTINEIFETDGEAFFRNQETMILEELTGVNERVISTGGGIVTKEENIIKLRKIGFIIWLKASPETVYNRVCDENHRPLLKTDNPLEQIKRLMSRREQAYSKADLTIDTDGLEVDDIVDIIIEKAMGRT